VWVSWKWVIGRSAAASAVADRPGSESCSAGFTHAHVHWWCWCLLPAALYGEGRWQHDKTHTCACFRWVLGWRAALLRSHFRAAVPLLPFPCRPQNVKCLYIKSSMGKPFRLY
jgi:hypothetical protein